MKQLKSVKFKIVLSTTVCLVLVGIVSNLYLYNYMNKIIMQKANDIDSLYLKTIQTQLDAQFSDVKNLGIFSASSHEVARAMRNTSLNTVSAKRELLRAQEVLDEYLRSSVFSAYVNKLLAFNTNGLVAQSTASMIGGNFMDLQHLLNSDIFQAGLGVTQPFSKVSPSITPYKADCLAGLFPISSYVSPAEAGYVYIELDLSIITDVLDPYAQLNPLFVATCGGDKLISDTWASYGLQEADLTGLSSGDVVFIDGVTYRVDMQPLDTAGIYIYNCTDISSISMDDRKMVYTFVVVSLSVLFASFCILILLSNYITHPIGKLIHRIKKISANDFSFDPEIEKSGDEIGEIGKVVNEMCLSINNLLKETEEQSEEKKNIEIDLLQSQVNPHFIYNTLDSIHWMAVIQKNPGICNITRSLSNLLKNMAKGFSQKIPLEEELKLLDDYVTIQSIRYMETFELINHIDKKFYKYTIVKLTLQPLVENAIFHGIEPSGVYGTITLDAYEDGDFLVITVEDSGVGMTREELTRVMSSAQKRASNSMNGIGVANVDKRLRLVYGAPCGLTIESEKGMFTRVSVRIRKEEAGS